jgi:ADP-heptose:LPS heptosyltransferase
MLSKVKFILLRRIMWALSVIGSRALRRKSAPSPEDVRRIAAIQFGGIGDMVLTTAALRELAHAYPNARISIVCSRQSHAAFLSNFPFVEDVIAFDIYSLDSKKILKKWFWTELLGMVRYLRSKRFNLLVNFHNPFLIDWFLIEFLLVALSRAQFSVGVNPSYLPKRSVYHRWISEDVLEGMHYKDFFLDIIGLLGVGSRNSHTVFPLREDDVAYAQALVNAHSGQSPVIAVIHPGASAPHNHWPAERYAELSSALTRRRMQVFIIGSAADQVRGEAISRINPDVQDLTGKTTLSQTAALIARAAVFVGNDSSQFHVAVAVNTPAVGLIGGGSPRFHLYSRENIRVIKKGVDCAPCRDRTCHQMECMKKIKVGDVLEAVEGLLAPAFHG